MGTPRVVVFADAVQTHISSGPEARNRLQAQPRTSTESNAIRKPRLKPVVLVAAGLALLIVIAFAQVRHFDFVNYDDHRYITHNERVLEGLTFHNVVWSFTTFDVGNWHPLTWLSHMEDVTFFGGDAPGAHHLVSVAVHIINAILLLALLNGITGSLWRSAAVAAVFALHPLRVESVAWISERKDVLSVFFGLVALLAYVRYVATPSIARYLIVAGAFACSLMSKPMLVTLPGVLLLLDYWPLKRLILNDAKVWTLLVIEKIPLIALSIASAIITMIAQTQGGSVSSFDDLPIEARLSNAFMAHLIYLWQTIWPVNLAPLYPMRESWPLSLVAISIVALVAISVIALVLHQKRPTLIIGWLWWLGTLVPVIGLIQVGSQAHADRYTYFPHIGLFILVVWSIPAASKRVAKMLYSAIGGCIVITLIFVTRQQTWHWRDSIALSEHTLRVTHENAYAHFNLANALVSQGRIDEALAHFRAAGDLKPRWGDAPYNLGNAHLELKQFDQAIATYDEAIRRAPLHVAAHTNRAIALAQHGDIDRAIDGFQRALDINSDDRSALVNFGQTLARANRLDDAVTMFERALAIDSEDSFTHLMLGNALARQDRVAEALPHFSAALRLNPGNPHAHMSMAAALAGQGHVTPAIAHLRTAEEIARAARDEALVREVQTRIERYQAAVKP